MRNFAIFLATFVFLAAYGVAEEGDSVSDTELADTGSDQYRGARRVSLDSDTEEHPHQSVHSQSVPHLQSHSSTNQRTHHSGHSETQGQRKFKTVRNQGMKMQVRSMSTKVNASSAEDLKETKKHEKAHTNSTASLTELPLDATTLKPEDEQLLLDTNGQAAGHQMVLVDVPSELPQALTTKKAHIANSKSHSPASTHGISDADHSRPNLEKLSDSDKAKIDKEFEAFMPTPQEHIQIVSSIDDENKKVFEKYGLK